MTYRGFLGLFVASLRQGNTDGLTSRTSQRRSFLWTDASDTSSYQHNWNKTAYRTRLSAGEPDLQHHLVKDMKQWRADGGLDTKATLKWKQTTDLQHLEVVLLLVKSEKSLVGLFRSVWDLWCVGWSRLMFLCVIWAFNFTVKQRCSIPLNDEVAGEKNINKKAETLLNTCRISC